MNQAIYDGSAQRDDGYLDNGTDVSIAGDSYRPLGAGYSQSGDNVDPNDPTSAPIIAPTMRRSPIQRLNNPLPEDHPFDEGNGSDMFDHIVQLEHVPPVTAAYADQLAEASNVDFQRNDLLDASLKGQTPGERLMELQTAKKRFIDNQNALAVPLQNHDKEAQIQAELEAHYANSPDVPVLQSPHLSDTSKLAILVSGLAGGFRNVPKTTDEVWQHAVQSAKDQNALAQQNYGNQRAQYNDQTQSLERRLSGAERESSQADANAVRTYGAERMHIKDQIDGADKEIARLSRDNAIKLDHATKQFDQLFNKQGTWDQNLQNQLNEFVSKFSKYSGMDPEMVAASITHPNLNDKTVTQQKLEFSQAGSVWKSLVQPYFNKGGITEDDQKELIKKQGEYATKFGLDALSANAYFPIPPVGRTSTGQKIDAAADVRKQTLALKIWHQALSNQNYKGNYDPQNDPLDLSGLASKLAERSGLPIESFPMPIPGKSWQLIASESGQQARQFDQAFRSFSFNAGQSDKELASQVSMFDKDHQTNYVQPFNAANAEWQKSVASLNKLKASQAAKKPNDPQYAQYQKLIDEAVIDEKKKRDAKDILQLAMRKNIKDRPTKKSIVMPSNPGDTAPFDTSDLPGGEGGGAPTGGGGTAGPGQAGEFNKTGDIGGAHGGSAGGQKPRTSPRAKAAPAKPAAKQSPVQGPPNSRVPAGKQLKGGSGTTFKFGG